MLAEEKFMRAAIEEAKKARNAGDYAIGAVIVRDGEIIASSPNRTKCEEDPTQHAEVAAIRSAVKKLGTRRLDGCVMYTTHEPCPMCSSAIVWAGINAVVMGARMNDMQEFSAQNGNDVWTWRTINIPAREVFSRIVNKIEVIEDFMRDECKELFHST